MTDGFPARSYPGLPLTHAAFPETPRYALPAREPPDDDGQISCFCGFADDDGHTVACDKCNKWNHTLCYYPEYDGQDLPEDLQHFCIECTPRELDHAAAHARQWARREQQDSAANGTRRQASKGQKKRTKESAANGWPVANNVGGRDQPPPTKRPKTSHRGSVGDGHGAKGHSRKRTLTNVLPKSSDAPFERYSAEFLRNCANDSWKLTECNIFTIDVSSKLFSWLQAPDEDFRAELGFEKSSVLMRYDGVLENMPGKADYVLEEEQDPSVTIDHVGHPRWKRVIIRSEPVPTGGFVGELKGAVGWKDDYIADPKNRWHLLRHPEPFVFFHHRLPIYIDTRQDGTELRYVRRSCVPNAELKILVTDNTHYRFCIMAKQPIEPGTEVALAWDTAGFLSPSKPMSLSPEEMLELHVRVSTVLSNCGPCACHLPPDQCSMSRFDRRASIAPAKPAPKRRAKKSRQISPLNTAMPHAVEARKEGTEEYAESQSSSPSAGRGSTSRDLTPHTNGISSRDLRKVAKAEELFRRQEAEEGRHRKKRHSVGSTSGTPTIDRPPRLSENKQYMPKLAKSARDSAVSRRNEAPGRIHSGVQADMDLVEAESISKKLLGTRHLLPLRLRPEARQAQFNARYYTKKGVSAPDHMITVHGVKFGPDGPLSQPEHPVSAPDVPAVISAAEEGIPEWLTGLGVALANRSVPRSVDNSAGSPLNGSVNNQNKELKETSVGGQKEGGHKDSSVVTPTESSKDSTGPNDPATDRPPDPSADLQKKESAPNDMPPPAKKLKLMTEARNGVNIGLPTLASPSSSGALGTIPALSPNSSTPVAQSPVTKKLTLSDYTRRKAKGRDTSPPPPLSANASATPRVGSISADDATAGEKPEAS